MGRKKHEDLETRVCVRGHAGNWIIRKNSSPACRECLKIAVAKHRGKELPKDLRGKTQLRREAVLSRVEVLKLELQILEVELESLNAQIEILERA